MLKPSTTGDLVAERAVQTRIKKAHQIIWDQLDIEKSKQSAQTANVAYLPIKWTPRIVQTLDTTVRFSHGSSTTFSQSCPGSTANQHLPMHVQQILDLALQLSKN